MFGVDTSELLLIAIAALIFIGPKDLPRAMRTGGQWIGKIRGMARHFTAGVETMMREAELEEMEKKWREENERIMQLHPPTAYYPEPGQPDAMPPLADVTEPTLPLDETQPGDELPPEQRPLP